MYVYMMPIRKPAETELFTRTNRVPIDTSAYKLTLCLHAVLRPPSYDVCVFRQKNTFLPVETNKKEEHVKFVHSTKNNLYTLPFQITFLYYTLPCQLPFLFSNYTVY